MQYKQQES